MINQIAVTNFIYTLDVHKPKWIHNMNLKLDAKLYKWNYETIKAIEDGINLAYSLIEE